MLLFFNALVDPRKIMIIPDMTFAKLHFWVG